MKCRAVRAILTERTVSLGYFAKCGDALAAWLLYHLRVIIPNSVIAERLNCGGRLPFFLCEIWRQQALLDMKGKSIVYVQKVIIAFPWVVAHQAELAFLTCREPLHHLKEEAFLLDLDWRYECSPVEASEAS